MCKNIIAEPTMIKMQKIVIHKHNTALGVKQVSKYLQGIYLAKHPHFKIPRLNWHEKYKNYV